MPKKTTLLVIGIAIVTLLLIFLAFRSQQQDTELTQREEEALESQTATLSFEETEIVADPGEQVTMDILVDTGGKKITGATVILDYDPEALSVNLIQAPQENILGSSQADYLELPAYPPAEGEPTPGRAIFGIGETLNPQTNKPKEGIDSIATVTFTVTDDFSGTTQIEIFSDSSVSETSVVTEPGNPDSILRETIPLTITVPQL